MLGGTSGEGVQWTVDDLDSGGGLMTNENKILVSESNGNVFVGTNLRGSLMGGGAPLVRKLNYLKRFSPQEFRNLKNF